MVAVLIKCTCCTFLALKSQSRSSNFSKNFYKAVKFPKTVVFKIFYIPNCSKTILVSAETNSFKGKVTNKKYNMSKEIDCNTKNGAYKLNCKILEEQYVCQNSNPLRIRMTGH